MKRPNYRTRSQASFCIIQLHNQAGARRKRTLSDVCTIVAQKTQVPRRLRSRRLKNEGVIYLCHVHCSRRQARDAPGAQTVAVHVHVIAFVLALSNLAANFDACLLKVVDNNEFDLGDLLRSTASFRNDKFSE